MRSPRKCPARLQPVPHPRSQEGFTQPGAERAVKQADRWAAPDPMLPATPCGHPRPQGTGRGTQVEPSLSESCMRAQDREL